MSAGQARSVARRHDLAPLGLTERQDPPSRSGLRGCEYDDVDLDLRPVCTVVYHSRADLADRPAEDTAARERHE
jgi:hypothetical protein